MFSTPCLKQEVSKGKSQDFKLEGGQDLDQEVIKLISHKKELGLYLGSKGSHQQLGRATLAGFVFYKHPFLQLQCGFGGGGVRD